MSVERGIRRTVSGFQVYVRIEGEFRSKRFPPDAQLIELRGWRERQKARAILNLPAEAGPGLEADSRAYLELVTGMTSYQDRAFHIRAWVAALGPQTDRKSIAAVQIRRVLETWRAKGLSAGSLNRRRTALMHWFTVLDGKSATNPVRDVPKYPEVRRQWSLPTWDQAEAAIAAVTAEKAKARLSVLMWTGWPSKQLMALTEADLDAKARVVQLTGRRKGRGTEAVCLPLLTQAVAALQTLIRVGAVGEFSGSSLHKRLTAGCKAAKITPFRVYDLRHRFLTTAATAIKDDRVIGALALHAISREDSLTAHYTRKSVDPRVTAAMRLLQKFFDKMAKVARTGSGRAKSRKR